MSKLKMPTNPGFIITWRVTKQIVDRRNGKSGLRTVTESYANKSRIAVEAKRQQLIANGYTVSEVMECFY